MDSQAGSQARLVQYPRACYEAGPTGYVFYWQLTQLGIACEVIAPSLVPAKAGDHVGQSVAMRRNSHPVTAPRRSNGGVGVGHRVPCETEYGLGKLPRSIS